MYKGKKAAMKKIINSLVSWICLVLLHKKSKAIVHHGQPCTHRLDFLKKLIDQVNDTELNKALDHEFELLQDQISINVLTFIDGIAHTLLEEYEPCDQRTKHLKSLFEGYQSYFSFPNREIALEDFEEEHGIIKELHDG
jgi:hypothetical protein